MSYKNKYKRAVKGYNSYEEHGFYVETTKRQMFLIIEQLAEQLKQNDQNWLHKALEEKFFLETNGIK